MPSTSSQLLIVLFFFPFWFLGGCAHYHHPSIHLESPECVGSKRKAQVELFGNRSAQDYTSDHSFSAENIEEYEEETEEGKTKTTKTKRTPASSTSSNYYLNPFFGAVFSAQENLDFGFRFEPGAPIEVRFKYQWQGFPKDGEFQNKAWDTVSSIVLVPGYFYEGSGVISSGSGTQPITLYSFALEVPSGIKLSNSQLLWLSPSFSYGALDGYPQVDGKALLLSSGANTAPSLTRGETLLYGVGLGHEIDFLKLFVRTEIKFNWGTFQGSLAKRFQIGTLLGIAIY